MWILQWAYFQSACFATGRRHQWHPLPSVVMVRQKVIQPQLLAFSNLLAEVSNSPTRRGVTEDIWGSSLEMLAAVFGELSERALHFYSEHTTVCFISCFLRSSEKKKY